MATEFKYWAFLSYSHQDNLEMRRDGSTGHVRWAEWLHESLETYKVPREFLARQTRVDETMPQRFCPTFQDEKELPINADLGESIREALRQSRFLIVICSPRSATSRYVNEEVRYFKELGRQNRIMTLMIDGEPNVTFGNKTGFSPRDECFCPALQHSLGTDNQIDVTLTDAQEPIAGDVRIKDSASTREALRQDLSAHRPVMNYMKFKLLAGLMGVGFDELVQRDEQRRRRQHRIWISAGAALVLTFAALAGVAVWQWQQAERQRQEAIRNQARSDFMQAVRFDEQHKDGDALLYLARSLRLQPQGNPASAMTFSLLAFRSWPDLCLKFSTGGIPAVSANAPAGSEIMTGGEDGMTRYWDPATGQPLNSPLHGVVVRFAAFSPDGSRIVTAGLNAQVWNANTGVPVTPPFGPGDEIRFASFSPDGSEIVTASESRSAQVWNARTGRQISQTMPPHRGYVYSARFSPDGTRIVTASFDRTARVWNATNGSPITSQLTHYGAVHSAVFSPDGSNIVTASSDGSAWVWNAQTGKQLLMLRHYVPVNGAVFSPNGSTILTASSDGCARVWDAHKGTLRYLLRHGGPVYTAVFSPDGSRIVTASADHTARVWDANSGTPVTQPLQHDDAVESAGFSPDGSRIVTASDDATARIWDAQTGQLLSQPLQHDGYYVYVATFNPDGSRILTMADDGTARVWDTKIGQSLPLALQQLQPRRDSEFAYFDSATFNINGSCVSTKFLVHVGGTRLPTVQDWGPIMTANPSGAVQGGSNELFLHTWDVETGQLLENSNAPAPLTVSPPTMLHLSQTPTSIIGAPSQSSNMPGHLPNNIGLSDTNDSTVYSMNVVGYVSGRQIQLEKPLLFSPDHSLKATISSNIIEVLNVKTGLKVIDLRLTSPIVSVMFSQDNRRLAVVHCGSVGIWDVRTGKMLTLPIQHLGNISSVVFSPDDSRVVIVTKEGVAGIWDARTGQPISPRLELKQPLLFVVFSPDGTRLLTVSIGATARLWDAATGLPLLTLPFVEPAVSAQFSPDGLQLLVLSQKNVQVWDVPPVSSPPDWLAHLAEAAAGQHMDNLGKIEVMPLEQIEHLKTLRLASTSNDPWEKFGRWFFSEADVRTISPWSQLTVPGYIQRCVADNNLAALEQVRPLAYGDPDEIKKIQAVTPPAPPGDLRVISDTNNVN